MTTFADELAAVVGATGRFSEVVRASVDGFDGILTQREELSEHWDLTVCLDVPFEVSVSRTARRDGTVDDHRQPGLARYVDGQRLYFARCDPRGRADVVVDNTDLAHPRVTSP